MKMMKHAKHTQAYAEKQIKVDNVNQRLPK